MDRRLCAAAVLVLSLVTPACQTQQARDAERRREENDKGSAAYKTGQAAHEIARRAEQAAAAAGRKLDESARKAREGWKEQERRDREKNRDAPH